jgi:hypothetical protein
LPIFSLWQEILQTVTLIHIRPDLHGFRFDQQVFLAISSNNSLSRILSLPDSSKTIIEGKSPELSKTAH